MSSDNTHDYDLESPNLETLNACLTDEKAHIAKRTRCVFLLRQMNTTEAIDVLCKVLRSPSILLAHEVAFCLGQMKNNYAIPMLTEVLMDDTYDPVVRHEAGEALGAICHPSSLPILEKMCNDPCEEVSDTCKIAYERVKYVLGKENADKDFQSSYMTVDPAPAHEEDDVNKLELILTDAKQSLFDRYRAMFKLRDLGSDDAIKALVAGFADKSPVLRHEIAYVMGQMQNPSAVPALEKVLGQQQEHSMVRHEAAEALGACGDDQQLTEVLKIYAKDSDAMIRESCEVALDIQEYWKTDEISSI